MKLLGLDSEFTSLRHGEGRVLTVCGSTVMGDDTTCTESSDQARLLLRNAVPDVVFALHNAKADFHALGVFPDNPVLDTLIASWLLDENGSHKLDDLVMRDLGRIIDKPIKKRDGKLYWRNYQTPLEEAPREELDAYCLSDATATAELADLYIPMLEEEGLLDWYWEVEEPFMRLLWKMEQRGIRIDYGLLNVETALLRHDVQLLAAQVYDIVGYKFNLNSPQQLGNVLYTKKWKDKERAIVGEYKNGKPKMGWVEVPRKGLGLKARRKSEKGQPATDKEALAFYSDHPVVAAILKYREAEKVLGTYLLAFPQFMHNGRLYGKFNQTGTVTGRLSSSEPNLQNIPARGELGKRVRRLFIPQHGHKLVISDLSQIEYRLLADLSGEVDLIDAFLSGDDIHERTAQLVLHVDQPTKEQRGVGKTANYAAIYGAGPRKVAQLATAGGYPMTTDEARQLLDDYYAALPAVRAWKEETVFDARRQGFVMTIGGRKRRLPDLRSRDPQRRSYAERQAPNAVIQGSAADLLKVAMVRMDQMDVPLLLQVHDEVVAEVPEERAEYVAGLIEAAFDSAADEFGLTVPVVADTVIADSWAEKG